MEIQRIDQDKRGNRIEKIGDLAVLLCLFEEYPKLKEEAKKGYERDYGITAKDMFKVAQDVKRLS